MGRGQLLKNRVRQEKALAEARVVGEAKGALKARKLEDKADTKEISLESLLHSAKTHIGLMIDRLDPVQTLAIGATTLTIHQTIVGLEDLAKNLRDKYLKSKPLAIPEILHNVLPIDLRSLSAGAGVMPTIDFDTWLWIISFVLAYFAVTQGATIMTTLGKMTDMLAWWGLL